MKLMFHIFVYIVIKIEKGMLWSFGHVQKKDIIRLTAQIYRVYVNVDVARIDLNVRIFFRLEYP